jgi:hypothetical protein
VSTAQRIAIQRVSAAFVAVIVVVAVVAGYLAVNGGPVLGGGPGSPASAPSPSSGQSATSSAIGTSSIMTSSRMTSNTTVSRLTSVSANASETVRAMNSTSWPYPGCQTLAATNSSQGYNLTVYVNSFSVTIGQSLCFVTSIQDVSGVQLTLAESANLDAVVNVTDPSGQLVFSMSDCSPSLPPLSNTSLSKPPQGGYCSENWNTQSLVDGAHLQPGTYQVNAIGSGPAEGGTGTARVTARFEVALSSP